MFSTSARRTPSSPREEKMEVLRLEKLQVQIIFIQTHPIHKLIPPNHWLKLKINGELILSQVSTKFLRSKWPEEQHSPLPDVQVTGIHA